MGVGPIKSESFDYFNMITGDFDLAKKMAAAEYLEGYLDYNSEDMADCDITDTKISSKGDDILYIVFSSPSKAKNVRRRIANLQNPQIKTREYVPPQFFQRYNALSKYASEARGLDSQLKTQIRFETADICLYTKKKGTDDPFTAADMVKIDKEIDLPPLENMKWTRKPDRPAFRQVSPKTKQVQLKSLAMVSQKDTSPKSSQKVAKVNSKKHKLSADSSD